MPGNQTGTEGEVEVKASYMTKRSQGKSALKTVNFKKRVFVLTPNRLAYFEGTLEKRGSLKGQVDLTKVKAIEKVQDGQFDKPSFQVVHGDLTLYVISTNEAEQLEWISLLREYCRDNASLQDQYHPGVFTNSKWSCCDHKSKHSTGCQPTTNFCQPPPNSIPPLVTSQPPSSSSARLGGGGGGGGGGGRAHRGPLPPTPIDELSPSSSNQLQPPSSRESYFQNHRGPRPNAPYSYEHHNPQEGPSVGHRSGRNPSPDPAPPPVPVRRPIPEPPRNEFEVLAMYDYPGLERGDLPLTKGQKVTVFDDSREYWWRARNQHGREGYIPSNYVKKVGLDSEDWFFPALSRTRAENILKGEGKEGGFVVRNSSRENMYTLSIW